MLIFLEMKLEFFLGKDIVRVVGEKWCFILVYNF